MKMQINPVIIADRVARETGLPLEGKLDLSRSGSAVLVPTGSPQSKTFGIVITPGWRSLEITFELGAYSADFVTMMGTDPAGRTSFSAVVSACMSDGAEVRTLVNGLEVENVVDSPAPWKSFSLRLRKGQLNLDEDQSAHLIASKWTARVVAALISLFPVEDVEIGNDLGTIGLPEGAMSKVLVNRYERDRRNRAAALAIHGFCCAACDTNLEEKYGSAAADFIEVHHVTPISKLGNGYVVNPAIDLIPLCPNCHGVAHRKAPPWTVPELRQMLDKMGSSIVKGKQ